MAAKDTAKTAKPKGEQVSTTIPKELFAALDDYQWTARKRLPEMFRTALEEYAVNHIDGYSAPAPEADPKA